MRFQSRWQWGCSYLKAWLGMEFHFQNYSFTWSLAGYLSSSPHGPPEKLLRWPHNMAAVFLIASDPREQGRSYTIFCDLASKFICHHCHNVILFIQVSFIQCGRVLHKGCGYQEVGFTGWGYIFEAGYHRPLREKLGFSNVLFLLPLIWLETGCGTSS